MIEVHVNSNSIPSGINYPKSLLSLEAFSLKQLKILFLYPAFENVINTLLYRILLHLMS